jgi:hypothetical protein
VLGDAGKAHGKGLGQFGHGDLAGLKTRKNGAARGIGQSGESGAKAVRSGLFSSFRKIPEFPRR